MICTHSSIRAVNASNLTSYVELAQAPASDPTVDAILTIDSQVPVNPPGRIIFD